ncbi:unnamed protein product [Heterobilharzia americana]|nr:unnamed protein product [Heterobilharzia americana]
MIKGFAKIVSGPECDMRLKMYSVEEFSPTEGSSEYEKHSVKFCLENGRLKSIEYSQDEKNHSINLKNLYYSNYKCLPKLMGCLFELLRQIIWGHV